jgi:ribose 5-phosphate isomerase B
MKVLSDIIAIGSDHAGFLMKEFLKKNLENKGYKFQDYGAQSEEPVDYPDVIHPLAADINDGKFRRGVILCGSGNGAAIVANKYKNIRAAYCWNREVVKLARKHNDANIIVLPARYISNKEALRFTEIFLETAFEGGRHQRRIDKITENL